MKIEIYTDGGCWNMNGIGGYAALMFADGAFVAGTHGGGVDQTNNTMELKGLIAGLKLIPTVTRYRCPSCGVVEGVCKEDPCDMDLTKTIVRPGALVESATIFSDSQYCVQGATTWVHSWKAKGWLTAEKKPVKNKALWEEVDLLTRRTTAVFRWVKGHNGDAGNELADEWATEAKRQSMSTKGPWEAPIPMKGGS